MSDQTNREKTLDRNFVETIELLNQNKVPYWVCHGSLLGLIRDGQLIPWDHDIDIAIWSGDYDKASLIRLMASKGYQIKDDGGDYDFAAFTKDGGREVDFNYYRTAQDPAMAFSEWFITRSKLFNVLELIAQRKASNGKWSWLIHKLFFLHPIASLLIKIAKKMGIFHSSAGYTTPSKYLRDFELINISGLSIRVPKQHQEVLAFVYGDQWRVVKKDYDWTKESPSTRISRSRFGQSVE
jgi:hypothetical protein